MRPVRRVPARRVVANDLIREVFAELADLECHLVGGSVRDRLAGRPCRDADFIVGGNVDDAARRIAGRCGGRVVSLGRQGLRRIVLTDGRMVDLAPIMGTLQEDLGLRDFSVNAMSWTPRGGLVDYYGGLEDMRAGRIRIIAEDNLRADPLRIIRAYRICSDLGFVIEPATRSLIRMRSSLLRRVKSERITLEFFRLLNGRDALEMICNMINDSVADIIISLKNKRKGILLEAISRSDGILNVLHPKYRSMLEKTFSQGLTYRGLLRLHLMLAGSSRNRLRLSCRIASRVTAARAACMVLGRKSRLTQEAIYGLLEGAGDAFEDAAIVSGQLQLLEYFEKYNRLKTRPLCSADEICRKTGISPGPALGEALMFARREVFLGRVRTKEALLKGIGEKIIRSNLT